MSTLHTVNKPLTRSPVLKSCLRLLQAGDCLLLLEDGVYEARDYPDRDSVWADLPAGVTVYVLEPDLAARGLAMTDNRMTCVDDAGFVQLVCDCERTVSWF